ncbi:putative LPS assembly protein LptD [Flavobacterium qiangtangense]|uniref:LPS assembly protein LptD n=1 Tax=Flavobacterium qiangtangense TaxID=1442595 RepID=A0ABW1PJZ7_9FLAO
MARQKVSHIFTKIVFKPLRTNLFHIVLSAIFLTLGSATLYSQEGRNRTITVPVEKQPTKPSDTAFQTVNVADILIPKDSTKIDSLKPKKNLLEGIVKRKAVDYEKMDQKKKLLTLYNQAELYYQDFELKAGVIVMDYSKNEVYAGRFKDSLGNYSQRPVFKQGSNVIEPDSIRFNTKTKKALVWNSRTKQGEMNIIAETTKKINDSVYYMAKAKLTTSKDIDNPEYYFYVRKLKFVPGKKVVVGLTNLVIADVPVPLGVPFAFFPMSNKSTSGLILPSPNDSNRQGFSLQNGGLYLALSDNYDLAIVGDYYTNGSYAMRFESSYGARYKYRGNVNVRFENQIQSERGFPDYAKSSQYNIQWSHSQDAKSSPNSRFSASVNLGSSKYYQQTMNQSNIGSALNNTLSSSVSYSKTFNTVPQVNMSITATHSQNTGTETINMTLPTFQASVDRIYLFASEDEPKKGFIKNLNLQYNINAQNQITTNDSLFFKPQMFRDAKIGFQHSIPLSTNFKVFKYFSVSTGMNYEEVWALKTLEKRYNYAESKLDTIINNGFDAYRTYSFSSSVGTTIYGTFNFGEDKRIQAIRHLIKPAVSYSYRPSFEKYYDTYDPDGSGTMLKDYSRFENGIYGAPGKNMSNTVGFSLNNTFEAKVTDRDSTKTEAKKVMLLNSLNFSTSYNLNADSLKLAPIRVSAGTVLFKDKMNINFAATLNPYALDNANRTIEKWNIDNGGSLFRMTSANVTINYSFSSTDGANKKDQSDPLKNQSLRNGGRDDDLFGTARDLGDNRTSQFNDDDIEKAEENSSFYNAVIPWDVRLAYSLTYGNEQRQSAITSNSLMVSGNIDLTPRWKVGVSTGYDFVQDGVTFTQLRFERDLLSWRMDFNWVPIGNYTSWGFFIGIKSSVLSDIKWDKRNQPNRTLR